MSTLAPTIDVVLGINKTTPVATLIEVSTTVIDKMTANKTTFSAPNPALTTVSAAVTTLSQAQSAFKGKTGSRAARDGAWIALVQLMQQLRAYVQGVVCATPAQASQIAEDAAMRLKKTPTRQTSDLSVKAVAPGSVKLVAKTSKGAKAHEFQYSTDGGKTWIAAPPSTQAHTTLTGLQSVTTIVVRHRPITKAGAGVWSQTVTAVVT